MSQLVYAFVARGTTVLAEYNLIQGSYQTVAVDCLRNLQERMEPKFTITADRHTFNFLNDAGYSTCTHVLSLCCCCMGYIACMLTPTTRRCHSVPRCGRRIIRTHHPIRVLGTHPG